MPCVKELKDMNNFKLFVLQEKGGDIREVGDFGDNCCFMHGDHIGMPKKVEDYVINKLGAEKISVGPLPYLASSCIAVVHNEIDRRSASG